MNVLQYAVFSIAALLAGSSLVIQSVLNSRVRINWDSAYWAAFYSYLGGLIAVTLVLIVSGDLRNFSAGRASFSWLNYSGGVFGAIYITTLILLLPKLGAGSVFTLLVAGQMVTALAFDHFGISGVIGRQIDLPKAIGVGFLVCGVYLIRR